METWKRTYSNNDTKTVAMPFFWENFDKENYSIWHCEYKYPEELKMVFMSCNLITGNESISGQVYNLQVMPVLFQLLFTNQWLDVLEAN